MTEGVRYLFAGAITNVVVLLLYYGLTFGALLSPSVALATASLAGVPVGYLTHALYTFPGGGLNGAAFIAYAGTYLWSALFQWGFLMLFWGVLGFNHAFVVLVGLGSATAMSFMLQRHWVFHARG